MLSLTLSKPYEGHQKQECDSLSIRRPRSRITPTILIAACIQFGGATIAATCAGCVLSVLNTIIVAGAVIGAGFDLGLTIQPQARGVTNSYAIHFA
jgi:hypothetical protein